MDRRAYEETCELLRDAGYAAKGESNPGPFGSWLIAVEHLPRLRVVWDGKDRWVSIAWQTDELFSDRPVWSDLWIGKKTEDQTLRPFS
jgi:hypothetical protein